MPRGMRIIEGSVAAAMTDTINTCRRIALDAGFEEVIFPSVWEQSTFVDKAGPEILGQMYTFPDKKGRDLCLIPEVTALVQATWRDVWSKTERSKRIFYVNRCYRYERPQAGRYREFTQFGVEILGNGSDQAAARKDALDLAMEMTAKASTNVNSSVKRGLDYYLEDGFEIEAPILGAQKQICGGGRYESGVGFAIGIDRLVLAVSREEEALQA